MSQADGAFVHHESIFEEPPLRVCAMSISCISRAKGAVNAVLESIWTCAPGEVYL